MRRAVVLLGLILVGCSEDPDFVLVNRSDVALAFAPGVIVPACSSESYSEEFLRAAGEKLLEFEVTGSDPGAWVPQGAVQVGIDPVPQGATRPVTVIVSNQPAQVVYGPVAEGDLPACGGQPDLGAGG